MTEEINKILDELIDDFRFVLNCFLDFIEDPAYYIPETDVHNIKEIFDKWFT